MAKNVLELNGKRYDAITGAYLGASVAADQPIHAVKAAPKPVKSAASVSSPGRVIDGFIRPTNTNGHIVKTAKPQPAHSKATPAKVIVSRAIAPTARAIHHTVKKTTPQTAAVPKPVIATPVTPQAAKSSSHPTQKTPTHAAAHKPEKSKTLMRRAVRKPEIALKPSIKPQAPAEIAPMQASELAKPSALQIDEERLARAKSVHITPGIRHFQPVRPDYTPDAIDSTPRHAAQIVPSIAVRQAPLTMPVKRHAEADIFEAALARAESHKQPAVTPHKKRSKHRGLTNALAGIAAFLVIAGFIGYMNMPNIQLRVASIQAGFTANLPAYKPDGYAMRGGVQRIGNTVSMRFTAGDSAYTVTQQPSDWNSQTLIDNTVALSNGTYKTVQAGGRNVYVYNGSNAVWVDGGVRYDLTSSASLSTQDITQLAASL